jgi:hypothetical protein
MIFMGRTMLLRVMAVKAVGGYTRDTRIWSHQSKPNLPHQRLPFRWLIGTSPIGYSGAGSGQGVPLMDSPTKPLAQRLGWFVLIWTMAVVALAIIAWLIRMVWL